MSSPTSIDSGRSDDFERAGADRIERIAAAVERAPWGITLLQLAWTAGPVTLIGAAAGYYVGFGQSLPLPNMMFFLVYTIITGVIGIVTKFIYDYRRDRAQERREQQLAQVIDRLPVLIHGLRDLAMVPLSQEARRREAAAFILQNGELEPEGVAVAVEEITGNRFLAAIAARIELYRSNGMWQRVHDLTAQAAPQAATAIAELRDQAPEVAAILRGRLGGAPPTLKQGVVRESNFVERILAASEAGNEALMTLRDAEEMLLLTFELISGRRIPLLAFHYKGRSELARAADALEQARGHYRIAQATVYSRLLALVTYLGEERDLGQGGHAAGQPTAQLLHIASTALDQLTSQVNALRHQVWHGALAEIALLRRHSAVLARALQIHAAVGTAYTELGRQHAAMIRAQQRWEMIRARYRAASTELRPHDHWRGGLRISERCLALDDEAKMAVAERLQDLLQPTLEEQQQATLAPVRAQMVAVDRSYAADQLGNGGDTADATPPSAAPSAVEGGHHPTADFSTLSSESSSESTIATDHLLRPILSVTHGKRLAIEAALALEPHIGLTQPEVQRAINSSGAAHLRSIEPGASAATKAALGAALVREVRDDRGVLAESLALALVRHYGLLLDERAIEFLNQSYGANRDVLRRLAQLPLARPVAPSCRIDAGPPPLPRDGASWQRQLKKAQNLLERISS